MPLLAPLACPLPSPTTRLLEQFWAILAKPIDNHLFWVYNNSS